MPRAERSWNHGWLTPQIRYVESDKLDAQLLFSTLLWTAGASCSPFPARTVCSLTSTCGYA